jgi:hypothetical protein
VTPASPLDALFRVPPEGFTAARNRLVAELRKSGEVAVAASVAKLPRPTPVVWAINQVARQDPAAVARLVEAVERLKQTQLGHGSVDMPAAAKAYHEAVQALAERSLGQLAAAGRSVTAAVRARLTQTLTASVTNGALRESLRAGRLNREQMSSGFDVFGQARPTLRAIKTSETSPPRPAEDREATRRRAELELRFRTARADLARAQERARELERKAVDEARSATEARERAAAAREAAAQGRAEVRRAEAKVRAAGDAAKAQ